MHWDAFRPIYVPGGVQFVKFIHEHASKLFMTVGPSARLPPL